jgi:hypothetical protein
MKLSVFLAAMLCPGLCSGALVFTATKSGVRWQIAGNGSLNLNGLGFSGIESVGVLVHSIHAAFVVGSAFDAPADVDYYTGAITGPESLGNGIDDFSSGAGDTFGFYINPSSGLRGVYVPQGYISGSYLSGIAVFQGFKTDQIHLNPGTYVWTLPNDTITLTVIPEPSTALLLLPAAGLLFRRRRASRRCR